MKIEHGCLISLSVRMFNAQGELLEATEEPIVYLHGSGDIFPRIEAALNGREAGYRVSLTLEPHEAFGDFDAELVQLVDVAALGASVTVGMRFEGLPNRADGRVYTVTDVAEGVAVLDANHPLAGRVLRFDVEVIDVQPASADERVAADTPEVPDFLHVVAPQDLHDGGDRTH
jgi:FKBP-type peptidyl-prolyl cis-trans isomerase SlyD